MITRLGFFAWVGMSLFASQISWADHRAGLFISSFSDTGIYSGEWKDLSSMLLYREFTDDPTQDAPLRGAFSVARSSRLILQFGFEPNLMPLEALIAALSGQGHHAPATFTYELTDEVASTVNLVYNNQKNGGTLPPGVQVTQTPSGVTLTINELFLNQMYSDLVRWNSFLENQKVPVFVRPMSEINLGDSDWELYAKGTRNTPARYIQAWTLLSQVLHAPNIRLLFEISSWKGITVDPAVVEVLKGLPAASVWGVGIHPYAVARANLNELGSFAEMVDPWLQAFSKIPALQNKPRTIGEMGIAANVPSSETATQWDQIRAQWIHDAFSAACSRGFVLMTYFGESDGDVTYRIDPKLQPLAHEAFQQELSGWGRCHSL